MARVIFPPTFRFTIGKSLFLAGSIEMGKAEDWQSKVSLKLDSEFEIIYNPRRPSWDNSWKQSIDSPEFNVQVTWELEMMTRATSVIIYFQPNTISPISLLELGIVSQIKPASTYVCCPEGFHRKGNVDIVCERYGIKVYNTLDQLTSRVWNR